MARSFYKRIIIIFLTTLAAVFLNSRILNNPLQNIFYKAVQKPGIFLTGKLMKFSLFSRSFFKTQSIIETDLKLKEENNILLGKIAELDSLKRENDFLRSELGVAKKLKAPLLLVKIFSIQRNPLASAVLINRGRADGVKKSMAVIASGNILVGLVNQVFENTAEVIMPDDPRAKISARIGGSNILADAKGELAGNINLGLITNKDEIKKGDITVTSGLDGLPESLIIAKISDIDSNSGNLFKKVKAKMIFDQFLGADLFVVLQ